MRWLGIFVINGCQSDTQGRRDNDVRTPCNELRRQVIEIVFESDGNIGFIGLRLHDQRILIITIDINLCLVLNPIYRLKFVRVKSDSNVLLFLLAFVEMKVLIFVLRWGYERILLAQVLLLTYFVPDLKDLILTGRNVLYARVDCALLCHSIDELLRIDWLLIRKIVPIDVFIDFEFFLLVLNLLFIVLADKLIGVW